MGYNDPDDELSDTGDGLNVKAQGVAAVPVPILSHGLCPSCCEL